MMAGLLARGSVRIHPFPAFGQWDVVNTLSAYSCGGSHGFGPFWVVLTVFPFSRSGVTWKQHHRLDISHNSTSQATPDPDLPISSLRT